MLVKNKFKLLLLIIGVLSTSIIMPLSAQTNSVDNEMKDSIKNRIHFSGKVGYVIFTDKSFYYIQGWTVGADVYGRVFDNLYLGGEINYTKTDFYFYFIYYNYLSYAFVNASIIPIEINLKYSLGVNRFLYFEFGGGASINYLHLYDDLGSYDHTEWGWGFQPFVNMNFKFNHFFFGINLKYNFIQDFKEYNISLSNLRSGVHIGGLF